jgi:hypothetical protein
MSHGLRIPSQVLRPVIEWRARRIADPVERLRFLRRVTSGKFLRLRAGPGKRWGPALAFLVLVLLAPIQPQSGANNGGLGRPGAAPVPEPPDRIPIIWLVERTPGQEIYSNGLRIETGFAVAGETRSYQVYDRRRREPAGRARSAPAGIVYHTTESHLAPFAADQNRALRQIGEALVAYVRRNRCYHYLIDRFGRVWRVVEESDAANHAGYSVWADGEWLYVNLNRSFLGVSFETQTRPGAGLPEVTPAQVLAARLLTGMLRSKYRIPARNCVTHAQVSVNPQNMRIGYHTDWAGNFPYGDLELADNYRQPTAALWAFGFGYDPAYLNSTGSRLWQGLSRAEDELRQEAAAHGVTTAQYRRILQRKFQTIQAALVKPGATEERDDHEAQ